MVEGISTNDLAATSPDFGVTDEQTQEVKQEVAALGKSFKRTLEQAWVTGKALARAKRKVRHGFWLAYVEGVIGLENRTAQRLIEVYLRDPQKRHVSKLGSVAEALRKLPAPRKKGRDQAGGRNDDVGQAGNDGPSEARRTDGDGGVTAPGGDDSEEERRKDGPWSAALARVHPVLRDIGADGSRLHVGDLAALVELTMVAATTVKQKLALANESDVSAAGLDEAMGRLRSALEVVAPRENDGA